MNNGPWKLGGLPGLILEASDADDFFHFTCIGIEMANALPTKKIDKKFVKCSPKDFARMEREYYADRLGFLMRQMDAEGRGGAVTVVQDEKGNEIKKLPTERHIFIERQSADER